MSGGLTPEEGLRLEALFERAAALDPEDHAAFLDTECGPEGELREQLSVLLLGLAGDDLLGHAQVRLMSRTGTRVGPYELGEKIGEGGMGEVYAAEQTEPVRRRVALKVIRPGLDTEQVIRRFEVERQALARLSHPNVSQFFDAGATEDGCPYFAMEYVEGLSITDHCDRAGLSVQARLKLFLGVCEGVQHAHQKGIIHRDLKPSNLLVSVDEGRAVAKVIDFGIARATTGRLELDSGHTLAGQLVGTLDFMSPEQADPGCMEIDTRSDIYTLGVLLYLLVSGHLPLDHGTQGGLPLAEVQRAILEQTPRRPSTHLHRRPNTTTDIGRCHGTDERTLISQLTGDLDWICLKALEKDIERRYASVSEFAEDIRRHLAHRPVLARRPGALYRAAKFVRRNRVGVLAGGAVSAALLVGAVGIGLARQEAADTGEQLLKLRDRQLVAELVRKADEDLWPPYPGTGRIAEMEAWMGTAGGLVARLGEHQRDLARLRERALPSDEAGGAAAAWRFASYEDNLLHGELAGLVADLELLRTELMASATPAGAVSYGEHGWSVPQRLAFARDLEPTGALGALWASTWARELSSIRAAYPGLELHPQRGLLPLGPDPVTGLWEFAELLSGTPAVRGPDGVHRVTAATGLVLVLLPGGTSWLGSRGEPDGPNYDPKSPSDVRWAPTVGAVREVSIEAFLLSKYEMTRGQWAHFTGQRPSQDLPELLTDDRPVDAVTWNECTAVLAKMGLVLPDGQQWEYAARAGTETPWWTGELDASLESKENVLDERAAEQNPFWAMQSDPLPWSDADIGPAPVGSYAANGFGLFDVLGNISEWTAPVRDVPELALPNDNLRRARGGNYRGGSHYARSGCLQMADGPDSPKGGVGLRPVRRLHFPGPTL